MFGLVDYDSDDDKDASGNAAPCKEVPGEMSATMASPVPATTASSQPAQVSHKRIAKARLREIQKEISSAKSASAVVKVVRHCIDEAWDENWAGEALYQIAKRSTARTRKEWALDTSVKNLADKLCTDTPINLSLPCSGLDASLLLVALEGLRRMNFQDAESQRGALMRIVLWVEKDHYQHPVKSLARLYWLAAPLRLAGAEAIPREIRHRAAELDGPDVALFVAAMRHPGARDTALLDKCGSRLKTEGIFHGLAATDLVELAEGLCELNAYTEAALRPLGQEVQRRRGELTPDELHRVHTAFEKMKLPLPKVWTAVGTAVKREGAQIVTTQAFAPQQGHEKKRRGNHDVERTSPPRVVRDYKMMSY